MLNISYFKVVALGCKRVFVYRGGILLGLFSSMISIFILQKFWQVLYGNGTEQYFYMSNYAIVAQILNIIYSFDAPQKLVSHIRTGGISVELLRPWNYLLSLLSENLGMIIGNTVSSGLVLLIVASFLFGMKIPTCSSLLLFLVSGFQGFVLLFLIKMIVALASFWLIEASSFLILIDVVIKLLSGIFLPSWLMPNWLEVVMNRLPFVWIYQEPIKIYLSNTVLKWSSVSEYFQTIGIQLIWVGILYLIFCIIWKVSVKKINVQGG